MNGRRAMTMRRRAMVAVAAVWAALGALALPVPALAHALRVDSSPEPGAALAAPPSQVVITFGERPDPQLSTIQVVDTSGTRYDTRATTVVTGHDDQLQIPLRPLPQGVYTVTWRTVSDVDGHLASGAFAFGVGVAPPGGGAATTGASDSSPPPSPLAIVGRWLLYVGVVTLLGVACVGLFVARASRLTAAVLGAAWALAAAGVAAVAAAQAQAAGIAADRLLHTAVGHATVARAAPLVVAAAGVGLASRRRHPALHRAGLVLVAAGAAGAMLGDVVYSHAAARSWAAINSGLQWLHILAAGVWIGGLVGLLATLRGTPGNETSRAARRFSAIAAVALGVVVVTGVIRAVVEIGAWGRVLTTAFGQLVTIKAGVVAAIAALGAVNRFRFVPRAHAALRGLRRVGSTEVALGAVILLVTASLVNTSPPASAQATPSSSSGSQPIVLQGNDDATTVRVRLTIDPGTAGFNSFTLLATDYDSGAPLSGRQASLHFEYLDSGAVGASTLALAAAGAGTYAARGSNLSLDGRWRITVLLQGATSAAEVPLTMRTRTVPPRIDTTHVGSITVYTIHLAGGTSVQVYYDPATQDFHATFFDAQGTELPVTSATITMTPPQGQPVTLPSQELEPGHFVAPVTVGKGRYRFTIAGTTSAGDHVAAQIDITPAP